MSRIELKQRVWMHNHRLAEAGLVTLTWGNVSELAPDRSCFAIKPSGVPYADLRPEHIVVVDLEGCVVEGSLRPSSDTPTHLELYRMLAGVGGIAHSHSRAAVAFAQARLEIPCLGTTHADHFRGAIPVTRQLEPAEVDAGYERSTGRVIVERFATLDPLAVPGVLVAGHGPFTWGRDAAAATDNAIALEAIAAMAATTLALRLDAPALERHLLDKHHARKHGADAYYGQDE